MSCLGCLGSKDTKSCLLDKTCDSLTGVFRRAGLFTCADPEIFMRGGPTKMVFFGHRRGGVQPPPPSRNYLFLGKIFKFKGGGGPDPRSPLCIRARLRRDTKHSFWRMVYEQSRHQPACGWWSCLRQLVFKKFRNFQKTQNIVFGGWFMDSI